MARWQFSLAPGWLVTSELSMRQLTAAESSRAATTMLRIHFYVGKSA